MRLRELEAHLIRAEALFPGHREVINLLKVMRKSIMSEIDDLKLEWAQVKGDIGLAVTKFNTMTAQIETLQQQLADGQAINPADLEALAQDMKATVAPLEAIVNPTQASTEAAGTGPAPGTGPAAS